MLGVGSYSVGLGLFVAGGVVAAGGMTVGVSFGLLCGGCCNPCGGCVCGRHCGFGLLLLMAGEEHGGWGLVAVLLGCPVGVFLMGCFCGGRRAVRVVFGVVW